MWPNSLCDGSARNAGVSESKGLRATQHYFVNATLQISKSFDRPLYDARLLTRIIRKRVIEFIRVQCDLLKPIQRIAKQMGETPLRVHNHRLRPPFARNRSSGTSNASS
jgi:hypothetical protein